MSKRNIVLELIKNITGQANILAIPKLFIKFFDDVKVALLFSQIYYWTDRTKDSEGWFYKSYKDFEDEICLSENEMDRARMKLEKEFRVIETKLKKVNEAPILHWRVKGDEFLKLFTEFLQGSDLLKSGKSDLYQKDKSDLVETTKSDLVETTKSIYSTKTTSNKDYKKTTTSKRSTPVQQSTKQEKENFVVVSFDSLSQQQFVEAFKQRGLANANALLKKTKRTTEELELILKDFDRKVKQLDNPPAWLNKVLLQEEYSRPKGLLTEAEKKEREAKKESERKKKLETERKQKEEFLRNEKLDEVFNKLSSEEQKELEEQAIQSLLAGGLKKDSLMKSLIRFTRNDLLQQRLGA